VLQRVFVLYTTLRFHWTPIENGAALAFVGLSQAVVQGLLVKRVVNRLGEARAAMIGCGLDALAFLIFAIAPASWVLFPAILIQAAGSIAPAAIRAMLSARVGPTRQGEMQGALSSVEGLTQIAAPLIAGGLFSLCSTATATVYFPGAPLLLATVMYTGSLLFVASATRFLKTAADAAPIPAERNPI
jgi:DHA1 family tetracycline resistance protein-like MFS transporter